MIDEKIIGMDLETGERIAMVALSQLELSRLHSELARLREENERLRAANTKLLSVDREEMKELARRAWDAGGNWHTFENDSAGGSNKYPDFDAFWEAEGKK